MLLRWWRTYVNPTNWEWIEKLVASHQSGDMRAAIALLPARTDTQWFGLLREYPRCFVRGKLHFSGAPHTAPFPSVVVYLGDDLAQFAQCFSGVGDIYDLVAF